ASETWVTYRPEAGFAGREAMHDALAPGEPKAGARGGTMGSPTLNGEDAPIMWRESAPSALEREEQAS
ncbi:MAG: hypothetical protein ACRDQT_07175, partial [Gaiellaceae bacterium]